MKTETKNTSFSPTIEYFVIFSVLAAFALQILFIGYHIALQYPSNQNLSGFVPFGIHGILLPALVSLAIYTLSPSRGIRHRLFETLVIATTSFGLVSSLYNTQVFMGTQVAQLQNLILAGSSDTWKYQLFDASVAGFWYLLIILLLWQWRRTKRWA